MHLHLYACEYLTPLPDAVFHSLLALLPPAQRQKAGKFRNWEDRHAAVLGKILLRHALQQTGASTDLGKLCYTETQKPYLPDGPAFNISHSGNRVVCLLGGQTPLGIDIESLTPLPFDDFRPQFSAAEWSIISNHANPLNAFYHFWTAKESILKADGRGLGLPLASIDLSDKMSVTIGSATWFVYGLPLFDNYVCHYCTTLSDPPAINLCELTEAELHLHNQ